MLKRKILRELIWLLTIVLVSVLYKVIVSPLISGNMAADISQHNTYYIFALHNSLWILIPGIGFIVYLIRAFLSRFNYSPILSFLGLSCLFILRWLENKAQVYYALRHFYDMSKLFSFHSNDNQQTVKGLFYGAANTVGFYYDSVIVLQILLVLFIAFIGFRIGKNWKRAPPNN